MAFLPLHVKSFKVFHCSVIKVLCCHFSRDSFNIIPGCIVLVNNFFIFLTALAVSLIILPRCKSFVNMFLHLFHQASGEGGIWTLAPLLTTCTLSRGVPSASLGTSPQSCSTNRKAYIGISLQKKMNSYEFLSTGFVAERRGWDSNPCALADKRFSRPPRYDHFDISP